MQSCAGQAGLEWSLHDLKEFLGKPVSLVFVKAGSENPRVNSRFAVVLKKW
jgi:hypothetical protein